jgi:hypothetical protein
MNITNSTSVQAASTAAQSSTAGEAQMLVLKKALDAQATNAQGLLDAIPQQPQLATQGAIGTRLHAVA